MVQEKINALQNMLKCVQFRLETKGGKATTFTNVAARIKGDNAKMVSIIFTFRLPFRAVLPTFSFICKLLRDLLIPMKFKVNHSVYGKSVRCERLRA